MASESLEDHPPREVCWHLQRCDGFMDLKMWTHARNELAQVPECHRASMAYRKIRLRLAIKERDWALAVLLARAVYKSEPHISSHWIQLAQTVRWFSNVESARTILVEALGRFPEEAHIPLNLARYEYHLGDREQAVRYLEQAISIDPACRVEALADQELHPLCDLLDADAV